ncbi:42401_t:CDS:2 [Gigaspora margarita]|uniref:42401_t:CDS:1 n=1 Tax=Gigaspora margarita TaxID=4874 RepID=A0ABN7VY23_GIGMA|nr:42401_t:CDS:2 [Gigaspora margarita]
MTKTQEVREEQVNFLKNHLDPSLQEEKLLDFKEGYDNSNYNNDWTRYEDWKKNREANEKVKKRKWEAHVSFHEQLDDELVDKTGLDFGKNNNSLVFPDGNSDEELTSTLKKDTLGYDGLAFLFNDSNEDAIIGKIDENTLEEETRLLLKSDKTYSMHSENIKTIFLRPKNPVYWEVIDLTKENLHEYNKLKKMIYSNYHRILRIGEIKPAKIDFFQAIKMPKIRARKKIRKDTLWNTPKNFQDYFDSNCENLENNNENKDLKNFDLNIQLFITIQEEQYAFLLKMMTTFLLFHGTLASDYIEHFWLRLYKLAITGASDKEIKFALKWTTEERFILLDAVLEHLPNALPWSE